MGKRIEFDIKKIVNKRGVYKPLCFKKKDKILKYDYDLEEYCKCIIDISSYSNEAHTKRELLADIISAIFDLGGEEGEATKESRAARMNRYNKRLIEGIQHEDDNGEKNTKVASDRSCYKYLKELEKYSKKTLLTPINEDIPYFYENKYLFRLISQLIEDLYASDMFNYVPYSNNFQNKCYRNHLKLIEDNIATIFEGKNEMYDKWNVIIKPLQELIYNGSYPGFREGDIWLSKCPKLKFFDCSYSIAKDYKLYKRVKNRLLFDLGDTEKEVDDELKKCNDFLKKNDIKKLFCKTIIDTFKVIMKEEFGLSV